MTADIRVRAENGDLSESILGFAVVSRFQIRPAKIELRLGKIR